MPNLLTAIVIEIPFLAAWLALLYRFDKRASEKGTEKAIVYMVVAGGLSVLPAWASYFINPFWFAYSMGSFAFHFLVVGLAEELTKFLTFIVMAHALKSIREPQDGIVQGAAVGVGFTLVENVLYGVWISPSVTLVRSFIVLFHALAGALWGFAWAGAVYENAARRRPAAYRQAIMAFIPVAALHSMYNTFSDLAGSPDELLAMLYAFELLLLVAVIAGYRWMSNRSPYHRFPYSEAEAAVQIISAGLKRNPGSRVLRRRLAVYMIACARYRAALAELEICGRTRSDDRMIRVLVAVARIGEVRSDGTVNLLRDAIESMSERTTAVVERELRKLVHEDRVREALDSVFNTPERALDRWAARRDRLRAWNAPRVVHTVPVRYPSLNTRSR